MQVLLNGRFVPEAEARISVFDRGFAYGDGLFETIRVANARPFRLAAHLERLSAGAEFLRIALPHPVAELSRFARQLIDRNGAAEAVLRLQLTRGVGPRGYSTRGTGGSTLVMSLHKPPPAPDGQPVRWRLKTASVRLPVGDPLTRFKTCNKLPHILARSEAEDTGADEALMLNTRGEVAEGAGANLFWLEDARLCTPPADSGALPGITRGVVMELSHALGLIAIERATVPDQLRRAGGVFLTLSTLGVVEATELDGQPLARSARVADIHRACEALVRAGCG